MREGKTNRKLTQDEIMMNKGFERLHLSEVQVRSVEANFNYERAKANKNEDGVGMGFSKMY